MKYVLDYSLKQGKHCFYGSMSNIFDYYNYSLSEAEIFILCNGLQFTIDVSLIESNISSHVLECINLDYEKQVLQFSKSIHCPVDFINAGSKIEIVDFIQAALSHNNPPLLFLNSGILNYLIYQNPLGNLGAHSIVVYGINNDQIMYADVYNPDYSNNIYTQIGCMEIDKLICYMIKGLRFSIYPDVEIKNKNKFIAERTRDMLMHYLIGKDAGGNICGHKALCKVLELTCNDSIMNKEKCQSNFIALILLIKSYFSSAMLYLKDLHYIFRFTNEYTKDNYLSDINQLIDYWTSFHQRCLSTVHKNSARTIDKIKDHSNHVFEFQKELFYKIISILN